MYHKPPESFVKGSTLPVFRRGGKKRRGRREQKEDTDSDDSGSEEESEESEEEEEEEGSEEEEDVSEEEEEDEAKADPGELDLLGLGLEDKPARSTASGATPDYGSKPQARPAKIVLTFDKGKGLQVSTSYARRGGVPYFDYTLTNRSQKTLRQTALKFNKNFLGCVTGEPFRLKGPLPPNESVTVALPVKTTDPYSQPPQMSSNIQMALKTELGVLYFQDSIPIDIFFEESGKLEKKNFLELWRQIGSDKEETIMIHNTRTNNIKQVKDSLGQHNIFPIAERNVPNVGLVCYFSSSIRGVNVLLELTFSPENTSCKGCAKSSDTYLSRVGLHAAQALLT